MAKNKNKELEKEQKAQNAKVLAEKKRANQLNKGLEKEQKARHAKVLEEKKLVNQLNNEQRKPPRVKPPAYLKKLDIAVREHFANAIALPTFLETAGTLTLDDRKLLVRQALILIEQNYVHLPLKRAMHSIDPVQRLKLLLHELEQTSADALPSEMAFHREMTEIFTSTHDGHTNYMLPAPFSWMTAFPPIYRGRLLRGWQKEVSHLSHYAGLDKPADFRGGR